MVHNAMHTQCIIMQLRGAPSRFSVLSADEKGGSVTPVGVITRQYGAMPAVFRPGR